jgi:hypothetical protein
MESKLCGLSLCNILNSPVPYSRDSVVSVATRLRAGHLSNYCPITAKDKRFYFLEEFRLALGPVQLPIHGYRRHSPESKVAEVSS